MVNTPITDNLFFRGSVSSEQTDGYYDNIFLGTNVDYRDAQNFRGSLRWLANENWTIDATYAHSRERNGQMGRQCAVRPDSSIRDNMLANGVDPADLAGITFYDDDPATSYPDGVSAWGGSSAANPGGHIDRLGPITTNGQVITTDGNTSVLTMWDWCNTQVAAGDYVQASEKDGFADADSDSVFFSADWSSEGPVGGLDNLEIRTNASWRFTTFNWILDRDYTPLPVDTLGHVEEGDGSNLTTRNLEVIFDMEVNERMNVLFGVYLFEEQSRTGDGNCWPKWQQMYETYDGQRAPGIGEDGIPGNDDDNLIFVGDRRPGDPGGLGINVFGPDTPCGQGSGGGGHGGLIFEFLPDRENPGGPGNAYQNVNLYNDSTAVFAHMTYALNDNWDLELGARWTEDEREFNIMEFEAGDTCNFLGQGICQPTPVLNYANVVEEGFFNGVTETFDEITPMVSLTRNLAGGDRLESGMIYFLYSEGFLTGSFNDELNIFLTPELIPLVTYQPEHVTNYEVGFKGTFADGRVRLNADLFFMDYEDKQEGIELDNQDGRFGPDPSIELTQNAGQVDIYGIELELRASPWDGGFVTVDASYLENEYNQFLVDDVENPGQQLDLSNRHIADRTPDWTLNVSVGHTFTLGNGATLTPTIGVYAQGGYEWLAQTATVPLLSDPHSYCYQDSYAKWRTRLTYQPASAAWEASLYGTNITDERYFEECEWARTGVYDYRYGAPDAWGLEFVARWGEN